MMFRFIQRLFTAIGFLSLVLLLGLATIWIRSYWRFDLFGYEGPVRRGQTQWGCNGSSGYGVFESECWWRRNPREAPRPNSFFAHSSVQATRAGAIAHSAYAKSLGGFDFAGFRFARRDMDPEGGRSQNPGPPGAPVVQPATQIVWNVAVPFWQPAALLGIVPACWLARVTRQRRQRRRARMGLCLRCGYDLRASQGRCPECGQIVQPQ